MIVYLRYIYIYNLIMSNLYMLHENITNNFNPIFLNVMSILSILCGILVIISKNPIVSVLFLIGLFLSIASYLMMLGMNFIGLSYLLVYVGAVSILFLFILMLINVRISELVTDTNNSIPLAILIGIFFNTIVYGVLPINKGDLNNYMFDINRILQDTSDQSNISDGLKQVANLSKDKALDIYYIDEVKFVSSQIWDGALAETSHITTLGNILYTSYPIWLILTSIILLLAMVGAIVITIKQKN